MHLDNEHRRTFNGIIDDLSVCVCACVRVCVLKQFICIINKKLSLTLSLKRNLLLTWIIRQNHFFFKPLHPRLLLRKWPVYSEWGKAWIFRCQTNTSIISSSWSAIFFFSFFLFFSVFYYFYYYYLWTKLGKTWLASDVTGYVNWITNLRCVNVETRFWFVGFWMVLCTFKTRYQYCSLSNSREKKTI